MRIEADETRSFAIPAERVWPLVSVVHGYLDCIPEVIAYETDSADLTAAFDARLKVGPVQWKVPGSAAVTPVVPGREVAVQLTAPKLVLGYEGALSLTDVGAGAVRVGYRGAITCEHAMIARLHFLLRQILLDHVDLVLDGVVGQAERSYQAERALLGRSGAPHRRS
ncbi:SRPBCC family protein [Pseudonocardia sp. KRD-184]|uniref:SRPBCC family protein n=1 Tax=Pseudonocardia oceani TaxID=2792013 RepID=A0ABS6U2G4_9PSEU|nr:SRPBCC family protein [Pseudonocardia oceani]MBW0090462.1 SRPBCC family protein [Pseudonocardia oceani]MBW0094996.1 SRPBCC family protein [Pseudonocardia oceani]MBW0107828.1 SRPBCC family protein [Pseudonocardia oceani]MBW0121449.1 SRPBCC family protein [Pseudonocardia oceani]MBW0126437.1 SRPBCC family protein [Pseudonocardia oceani]